MDMGLSKLLELVKDGKAWRAAVHGASESRTWLSDWTTTRIFCWPLTLAPLKFYLPWSIPLKLCFWGVLCCFANQALASSLSPLFLYTLVSLETPYGQQFPGGVWGCSLWFYNKCINFSVYWPLISKSFFSSFSMGPIEPSSPQSCMISHGRVKMSPYILLYCNRISWVSKDESLGWNIVPSLIK